MKTQQIWEIGDCLDLLPSVEDKSMNMILCDLPYGTTRNKWDIIIPFEPLWKEWKRIITDNGVIALTASQPFTTKLISSNIEMFKYCWIWKKNRSTGYLNAKKSPMKNYEDVCIFYKNQPIYNPQFLTGKPYIKTPSKNTYNGYGKHNSPHQNNDGFRYPQSIIEFDVTQNELHATQKPVKLCEYLIKTYTDEGDWVHDSCLGSGPVLEACRNTNRNCLGFEISDEWEHHYTKRSMKNIPQLETWF